MNTRRRFELMAAAGSILAAGWMAKASAQETTFGPLYMENCSVCHGENLEGAPQGTPLIGTDLTHGEAIAEISQSIAAGFEQPPMPAGMLNTSL